MIHRQWLIVWFYCQGLGKNRTGRLIIRKSGKEVNEWTFSNRSSVKVFVSYVNSDQRAYTIEKALNKQVDKIAYSVLVFSPATFVLAQWAHE